jgi:hypothetical protein
MGEIISVETGSMVDSALSSTAVENAKRDVDSVIIEESDVDGERKLAMASG